MAKVKLTGLKQIRRNMMKILRQNAPAAARTFLYSAGNEIMEESRKRAPVDSGDLRRSAYVTIPKTTGDKTEFEFGYGGAAAAYAIPQHERTELSHRQGEAKFLDNAVSSEMAGARRIALRKAKRAFVSGKDDLPRIFPDEPEGGGGAV